MDEKLIEHIIRFIILAGGIGFAVILGRFRPEWKSRKTIICWVWTIAAIDILIMDGELAKSTTALFVIGGAILLNVINFIGDRIENIKYKDFSASLRIEETAKQITKELEGQWPDGDPPQKKGKK